MQQPWGPSNVPTPAIASHPVHETPHYISTPSP